MNADTITAAACGFALAVLLFAAYFGFQEWRSSRCHRHRQQGNYSDARQPFRIVRGPQDHTERSEMLIAREARRAMRAAEKDPENYPGSGSLS